VALLDTGDFSGEPNDAGRIKTRNLIDGMGTMRYDVINVGEKDLADGVPAYLSAIQGSKLAVTSASFLYRDSGDPVFAPFAVKSYTLPSGSALKIGYLGLSGFNSSFAKEGEKGRVVVMRQPSEGLKLNLAALRKRVDFVVLLANLNLRELEDTLKENPGVDLVLATYAGRVSPASSMETIAGVPVLYAGDQGKRLGEVRLTLGAAGGKPDLKAGHVWLTRRYPSDPGLQSLIDQTVAKVNEANRKMAEARGAAVPAVLPQPASPGRPAQGTVAAPGATTHLPFLTSPACQSCHGEAWQVYQASAHAHAFETLKKANQDYNPECVSCHVTGFNEPQGYLDARQTPELVNVQCEACHGNAAMHVRDPQKPFGAVPPRRCFGCHTKENSPDFVFFKYWEQIKH
jgi:hypothetical protein